MKINLPEIIKEIKANRFAPKTEWHIESIELVKTIDSCYGMIDQYEIVVKFKAGSYDDNGVKYLVNHYVDESSYVCFYNGLCYLG